MGRAKAAQRARARAQREEQPADRARGGSEGAPPAERQAAPPREQGSATGQRAACAPARRSRGIARRLWSRVETAAYHAYGRLAGLTEERPALAVEIAAPALRALGVPEPRVARSVTVSRPRAAVLRALHDAEGVQRRAQGPESVDAREEEREGEGDAMIWAAGPGGPAGARRGIVSLVAAPGERGTEIRAVLPGARPKGRVARAAARILAELPGRRLRGDLRRLRQWIEVGEIPTTAGQPSGRTGRERT